MTGGLSTTRTRTVHRYHGNQEHIVFNLFGFLGVIGGQSASKADNPRLPRKHSTKRIASSALDGYSTPQWRVPKHLKVSPSASQNLFQGKPTLSNDLSQYDHLTRHRLAFNKLFTKGF